MVRNGVILWFYRDSELGAHTRGPWDLPWNSQTPGRMPKVDPLLGIILYTTGVLVVQNLGLILFGCSGGLMVLSTLDLPHTNPTGRDPNSLLDPRGGLGSRTLQLLGCKTRPDEISWNAAISACGKASAVNLNP